MTALDSRKAGLETVYYFLVFSCLGLAGNYLRYEIFFNIQFIFGSIFAMLCLQALGLRWGIFAAFIISLITFRIWNHPYYIIIMTCEAAAVGLIERRGRLGLVAADALYWLFAGIPMVFLFYYWVMHMPFESVALTGLKQSLNGVFNTLIARLVFMAAAGQSRKSHFFLRELLSSLFALFVLAPSLMLVAIQSRTDVTNTELSVRQSLENAGRRVTVNLETWLKNNHEYVIQLAAMADTHTVSQMQQHIDDYKTMGKDFLRMGLLDRNATIIAYSPLVDELGQPNIGKNFADRPFIPLLKQSLKPMLSEVVMGRIGIPRPIVTMLAPVISGGVYNGYMTGILDLESVEKIISLNTQSSSLPQLMYTLLDKNGRIIVTNHTDMKVMDRFTRGQGEMTRLDDKISLWLSQPGKNISISDRWKNSFYVSESKIGAFSEWKLVLDQPVAPFQKIIYDKYAAQLARIFALLMVLLVIGDILSRRITSPLETLKAISSRLPEKISAGEDIEWPQSRIRETSDLIFNFNNMAFSLKEKFQEIKEHEDKLEQRIIERTIELEESRRQYRLLAENTSDVVWRLDLKTNRFAYVSPSVVNLLGYTADEVMAQPVEASITPDSFRNVQAWIAEAVSELSGGRTDSKAPLRQIEHTCRDGTTVWTEVSSTYILDDEGRPVGIIGISRDISERINSEKAILEKTEELDHFFSASLDLLCITDREGRFRRLNPEWERNLGYPLKELEGTRLLDYVHPEDIEATKNALAYSGRKPISSFANRYRASDGTYRWLEWRSSPFGDLVYAAARDITKRIEAAEKVRVMAHEKQIILDTLTVGVCYIKERTIQWANTTFMKMFRINQQGVQGLKTEVLYAKETDYDRIGKEGYSLLAQGGTYSIEVEVNRTDGTVFWCNLAGQAVNTAQPLEGSIWMFQDITERKLAEEQLTEKNVQLERLTKNLEERVEEEINLRLKNEQILVQQSKLAAMGEMLGAIAHQWRQPLNALGLIVQNLKDAHEFGELDSDYLDRTVQKAMAQVQHMSKTIDDFRNFFQPDKDKTDFDAMQAIGDVLDLFSAQLQTNGIGYRLTCHTHKRTFTNENEIAPCAEKMVSGYRNEFEHVILNLVNNAREAILERRELGFGPRHGLLSFDFYNLEGKIIIRVSDNGGGIDKELVGRIFEPYFTTKGTPKGTGLGLYMSKVIIEDHMAGKISAANTDLGAEFTIELPSLQERDIS